jgi:hypothetical protein
VRMEKTWKSVGLLQPGAVLPMLLLVNVGPVVARQVTGTSGSPSATTTIDGKQIPPPPPKFGGVIKESAKDSTSWWPPSVVPPKGAPNVLLIMTDDRQGLGGHTMSQNHFTLGSPLETPADAKLIAEQLPPLMPTMFKPEEVGTPHFAQFVLLEDNQIGFFTVYDGSFDKYIADFTKNIGPIFDVLFKFTKGAPPSPCRKYLQEFIDLRREQTALRSGSTRLIQVYRCRTFMP